ncbi:MAG: nitroreductase family protein, partial [Clostridia bacterium]|nr:nitroreductase family protein [Clostridia bacterium]
VLVVLADRAVRTCVEDASLVIGNMMNAAFSVGVDSCWIHRAKQVFDTDEGKALLKQWGIEGDYVGVGNLILGYRDGEMPPARPRKDNYIYRV